MELCYAIPTHSALLWIAALLAAATPWYACATYTMRAGVYVYATERRSAANVTVSLSDTLSNSRAQCGQIPSTRLACHCRPKAQASVTLHDCSVCTRVVTTTLHRWRCRRHFRRHCVISSTILVFMLSSTWRSPWRFARCSGCHDRSGYLRAKSHSVDL